MFKKIRCFFNRKITVYRVPEDPRENVEMSISELTLYPLLTVIGLWLFMSIVIIAFS